MRNNRGKSLGTCCCILVLVLAFVPADASAQGLLVGDVNCDGTVNFKDINPFVLILSGARPSHAAPIDYWPLDGLGRDYGVLENHGVVVGDCTYSNDVPNHVAVGQSMLFDGNADYVYLGTSLLDGGRFHEFTFEAWFKAGPQADTHATIFANETTDGEFNVFIWGEGVPEPLLFCTVYVEGQAPCSLWGPKVTDNQWHHVAVRRDADHVALILDGVVQDSAPVVGALHVNGEWHATIGAKYTDDPAAFFQGLIDEVKVYDRALTDAQLASAAGLVAHWTFDDCDGGVAQDSSLNRHDGDLVGPPAWASAGNGCQLDFDGDDYVYIGPDLLGGRQFEQFTFEASFEAEQVAPAWVSGTIFKDETTDGEFNVVIDRATGLLRVIIYTANEGPLNLYSGQVVQADGLRHHVALRKNANEVALYVDGVLNDAVPATGKLRVNGVWHVTIGAGYTTPSPTQFFNGRIDNVKIYGYARTDGEIAFDATH